MRNDAFRSTQSKFLAALAISAAAFVLGSCGGGGAAGSGQGGNLSLLPNPGTAYAGIPFTLTIAGGRPPYFLGSSEPALFPVPAQVENNSFTVLPQQPGVVDVGLQPGEVPRRAVVVNVRESGGLSNSASLSVLQNFLVGYGVTLTSNGCSAGGSGAAAVQACPGRETLVQVSPTFNGQLRGNALLRFERLRGDFGFTTNCGTPVGTVPVTFASITQNTDTTGLANVCLFVSPTAPGQIAAFRIIDVATGVYTDQPFIINANVVAGTLTTLPDTITFTGTNGRCGTGSADFLVQGGSPPYTATSTNGTVIVAPAQSNTQPGRFTVTLAIQGPPCPAAVQIVVRDALGATGVVTVNSVQGAPGPALVVAPTTINLLTCGQSGSAVIVGGSGTYSAFSSGNGVAATVAGNQVLITRTTGQGGVINLTPVASTVNITDGTTIATITVNSPTNCP